MADTGQQELELLFFDTFSHENTEELNLDLVQFPRPVIIYEVRVIPLQTRVQADVPGGVRLGATNPSSFSLELFVNNLNKPNASTFEKLGMLNYKHNVDIKMMADGEIPTDGLILKGWYNTLTVAIYGSPTVVKPEHVSPPPPPPPQRAKQAVDVARSTQSGEQPRPEWEPPRQPAKPQQQHPLDYINQQVQLQKQQQQAAQAVHTLIPPPPHAITHPNTQSGVPPPQGQLPSQGVPPAKTSDAFPEQFDRSHHTSQTQHRDILQEFISSPKMGHMDQREGHFDPRVDPRQSPNVGRDNQFQSESREQFEFEDREFRGHRDSGNRDGDFERSRENSRDRDFREKEREVRKKEWERFRERERERSREKEREYSDRDSRDWPRSPSRRKSWSRSRSRSNSRSRSRSRSFSRSHSRSPRRSARSSRSPRRSFSRSPRRSRSRSPIRSRSRTPIRSRSRSPVRSYSRSPERRSRSPLPTPGSPLQTPLSPSRSRSHSRDVESPIHQIQTITRRQPDSSPTYMRETSPTQEEIMEAGEIIDEIVEDAIFDPLSPDGMNYSDDGEVQDIGDTYENISSDDELPVMEEIDHFQDYEDIDESWTFPTPTFNPYNTEFVPLLTFMDNSCTSYEHEKMQIQQDVNKAMDTPVEAKTLLNMVEEFSTVDHHDKWILALETAPGLLPKGLSYLLHRDNKTDVLDTLVDWALEGLDEQKAVLQPENAFKIRHLKMGIKLAGSLGCCDSEVTNKLLGKNVQHKLIDLFCSPCMSFSLRLQIVQALDHTTRIKDGFEWFMGIHPLQKVIKVEVKSEMGSEVQSESQEESTDLSECCYTRMLSTMMKKQNVRVTIALTALMKKIHTFQLLTKLSNQIDGLIDNVPSVDEKTGESAIKQEDSETMETEMEGMLGGTVVSETDIESIINNVSEIAKVFTLAHQLVGQPQRTLPGTCMFDIKGAQYNPYPVLYHMAHTHHLLESIFYLLSSPGTSNHPLLFACIRDLLQTLMQTQNGLLFLSSKPETINGIIRCLIQLADDGREEAVDENPMQQLGLDLVYYIQTLQYIDQLQAHQKEEKEFEDPGVISILHSLYTMTFTPQGRKAVITVLCMDNNLEVLMAVIDKTGDEELDARRKKSVCVSYSIGLILILLRHSTNVQVFEKFGARLVALSDEDFSSKLLEMQEWLAPVRSMTCYTHNSISTAILQLKQNAEDLQKIPRGLITTMRILKHMTIPPERKYPEEISEALKYRYAVLEMYSSDSLSVLINILQKVSEILLRPWQRGIPQSSEQISYHLAVVKPTLEIVKYTLGYLILARGTEFRDLTSLPVLFELHTVLCSVPISSSHLLDLQAIQKDIMDALMTYTQPVPSQSESDESLSQSLWTKTMKELLKYTTKAPYTYLSGLLILSELLPLPLPIQTKESLSEEDVQLAVNCRKLWSIHLHFLTSDIQEMIQILATSTCQPLQQVLRRVCWQLSDLSAPMAVMVTKCILDMVVESFQTVRKTPEKKEEGENADDHVERIATVYASKMLHLLAFVLSQPSIKCAALQLMTNEGDPTSEKYGDMLPHMLEMLNSVCQSLQHIQAQECIVSILQSICDPEVALVIGDTVPVNDQIAYSLPNTDYMTRITTALLDHMGSPDHSYASILPCVRTLVMLTEHDYGFYHLKTVLEQKTTAIGRLMVRINTTFSKDSSDCLSTLSTLLEFLRLLMTVEATDEGITVTRTCSLSQQDLQKVLSWNPSMENHPLLDLEKLLEDCAKDEETLESLLDSMTSLMKMLRENDKEKQEKPVLAKPELPPTENLSNLYNIRTVFVVSDIEDERLNPDYWLSNPATDVADIEPDLIMFNMEDMCHKYCAEFNLEEELKKTVATTQAELTKPRRIRTGDRRKSQEISINRGRGIKRPFVAPMRGRGIARGMMGAGGRMDSFRTRTPNTSRPPSMHVDDFMKLEKGQSDQDNRNTGTPVSPIRRVDPIIQRDNRGRGRGFDRGGRGFNRGRFFTPPGNYGQRESNNIYVGGGGSGGGGGGRGGYNNRPKSNFESPRTFGRGNYPGSGDRRGGRDFKFSPRGRGYYNKDKEQGGRFMGGGFRGRRDNTQDRGRHGRSFSK